MSGVPVKKEKGVQFPLLSLYAARRLAQRRGDQVTADAIAASFEQVRQSPSARALFKLIKLLDKKDLIPFVRDSIDVLAVAGCLSGRNFNGDVIKEISLYSDFAVALNGRIIVSKSKARYCDRGAATVLMGRALLRQLSYGPMEMLESESVEYALDELVRIDAQPALLSIPEDPQFVLEVKAPALSITEFASQGWELAIVRKDPNSGRPATMRTLDGLVCTPTDSGSMAVTVPPHRILEVHAAALRGHWMVLKKQGKPHSIVAPLPDFSDPTVKVEAWHRPSHPFVLVAGQELCADLIVPRPLARALCRKHRWCYPDDVEILIEAVSET